MSKQTETAWAERVAAWRESGLSAARFASGREFAASTLRYWASRLKRLRAEEPTITFAQLARTESMPRPVTMFVGEARIEVFGDTDEVALTKAVRAARSRS